MAQGRVELAGQGEHRRTERLAAATAQPAGGRDRFVHHERRLDAAKGRQMDGTAGTIDHEQGRQFELCALGRLRGVAAQDHAQAMRQRLTLRMDTAECLEPEQPQQVGVQRCRLLAPSGEQPDHRIVLLRHRRSPSTRIAARPAWRSEE